MVPAALRVAGMAKRWWARLAWVVTASLIAGSLFGAPLPAAALPVLTATPITWNVIGLDSNNVNVGPNNFPVGARVCNSGSTAATNVVADFVWTSSDSYIDLRPGSQDPINLGTINAGTCRDAYFEVSLTRNSAAYDHTRRYRIDVTSPDISGTVSTPTPRELYVEFLISQSRNSTIDVELDGVSIPAGGTMTLMVGNTYNIRLEAATATNGYEQIEEFINFPNTIFRINSVATTYSANDLVTPDPNAGNKLYADGCGWENDPNSPNYRSCLGTGKYGGTVTVDYNVTIVGGAGSSNVLNTLIYDFSGSSYHYNADYASSARIVNVVSATLGKSFSPKTITPGGTSTLTFTISNPGPAALAAVNFTDNLPAGVTISSTGVSYAGCGSPSPSSLTVGDTSLSFSGITVAGLSTCAIAVSVTASTDGSYPNTSSNLFINASTDTGSFATDSLLVSSLPPPPSSCGSPSTLATWTMPTAGQGSGGPPPPYTTRDADVSSATAASSGGTASIVAGGVTTNAWQVLGGWNGISNPPLASTTPYFEFTLDTSSYGGVAIRFAYDLEDPGDWASGSNNFIYLFTRPDSGAFSAGTSYLATKGAWQSGASALSHTAATTGAATTTFRILAVGAPSNKPNARVLLDDVILTGCPRLLAPTLAKTFLTSPIARGATSTLRFTLVNPNAASPLTGVGFSDDLPTGLLIATPNGLGLSCTTGSLTGGTTTAVSGTPTISLSGATLSANANCTLSVSVLGAVAGQYTNISGNIGSTETGANTTSSGYGTAALTVIAPPIIAKSFTANPIFTGNSTSLNFSISNPNPTVALSGVAFSDTLPAGLTVADSSTSQCGGTLTATAATGVIALSGGSLAGGASCGFSVTVTGATAGLKTNSVTVASTNGGTGNTATADVLVRDPAPAIGLLKHIGPTASGPWTSFLSVTLPASVYYRFTVENIGDVPLTSVDVTDPSLTSPSPADCSWVDGDGTPLTAPFTLPVADASDSQIAECILGPFSAGAGSNANTATVSGTDTIPDPDVVLTDDSTASYGSTPTVAKAFSPDSIATGGTSQLTVTLGNSNASAITLSADLVDTLPAGVVVATPNGLGGTCPGAASAPAGGSTLTYPAGASIPSGGCSLQVDVSSSVSGTHTNTLAAGDLQTYFGSNAAPASDDLSVSGASIRVVKEVSTDGGGTWQDANTPPGPSLLSGTDPVLRFTVTNTGDSTLTALTLTDSDFSTASCTIPASLDPGESFVCSLTAPWASGQHSDTATATGDFGGTTFSDIDQGHYFGAVPGLGVAKSETSAGPYAAGDTIDYEIVVINSGNVTLTGVTASDPEATLGTCTPAQPSTLAPGEAMTCPAGHVVTQADLDAGSFTNTATGSSNEAGPETDDETVAFPQSPSMAVVKSSTTAGLSSPATVTYDYLVTNTGNVTLTGIALSDDNDNDDINCGSTTLAPGASTTCTATHTFTQAELDANGAPSAGSGNLTNSVTASSNEAPDAADSLDIPITQNPALGISKSESSTGPYAAGDSITYSIVVENLGNVTLTGVTISDPEATLGSCAPAQPSTLAPGETMACGASYVVTQADLDAGSFTNTATGSSNEAGPETDDETVAFTQSPALDLVKEVAPAAGGPWDDTSINVTVGDDVYYRITLTNSGNVTLTGLSVSDPDVNLSGCIWTDPLAVGLSTGCLVGPVTAAVGTQTNTASGDSDQAGPVSDGAQYVAAVSTVTDPAVTKSGNPLTASVGELVVYTLTVFNTGTADALNVVVTDVKPSFLDITSVLVSPAGPVVNIAASTVTIEFGTVTPTDFYTVTITTVVNSTATPPGGTNTVTLTTSSADDDLLNNVDAVTLTIVEAPPTIPETGFAPGGHGRVRPQPEDLAYRNYGELWLEVPGLGLTTPIVGVPRSGGGWDVTWLGDAAGYLYGTAFPTWRGNSVITAHVGLASGSPGPFAGLKNLRFGDRVEVVAWGQRHIYEVREVDLVGPRDQDVFRHEERSWLTLVTCHGFDEREYAYRWRIVTRAVLVGIEAVDGPFQRPIRLTDGY